MIVSPNEYNKLLYQLTDPNFFSDYIRIPKEEHIYTIDLNARKVEAPEFLSVETDSNAEILWFKVDRFYDNIDLNTGACWILYKNVEGKSYFYNAPIQIAAGEFGDDYLLIPWIISKEVTAKPGNINFSFQFFKLSEDHQRFLYVLNTQPVSSKVLVSLSVDIENTVVDDLENNVNSDSILGKLQQLTEAVSVLSNDYNLYWLEP